VRPPSQRVRRWLRPLTLPASLMYATAIASRNRRFDRGEGVVRIDRPVISAGNITTGGTGKTPMVAWIARCLLQQGRRPVIAMRGYKSQPGQRGDEELEYRHTLPEVEVLANPDRIAALRAYQPRHPDVDCVVLDDGFQHRRLHRDLDLVLIDARADTFRDELLPAGNLREPPQALARASAVIVTHADDIDAGIAQDIDRWHGKPPIAWARHAWRQLQIHAKHAGDLPIAWLKGKRVLTMFGIGNPAAVRAQVEAAGAKIMVDIPAGDHERFDIAKLATARGLCDGLDAMVVTRKDWVKIEPLISKLGGWPTAIIVPHLEIEFIKGEDALQALLVNAVPDESRAAARRQANDAHKSLD